MKIHDIENAVRKQLPFRTEQHFFLRTDLTKDTLKDLGMYLICGLASIYVPGAEDKAVELYELNARLYRKYINLYFKHIARAAEVMQTYEVDLEEPDFYRQFSNKFWLTHNKGGQPYKSGFILSNILSARREVSLRPSTSQIIQDKLLR